MGGLLAAEVALLPQFSTELEKISRHSILGTINFDCPFLGLHPGIIISGVSSLFRPGGTARQAQPPAVWINDQTGLSATVSEESLPPPQSSEVVTGFALSASSLSTAPSTPISTDTQSSGLSSRDPYYDPPFSNDIHLPVRTKWENAMHFMMKHSDGLKEATKSWLISHLEFGGCLADYTKLKDRYGRIRSLENNDMTAGNKRSAVRFVNYYTASTGRLKRGEKSNSRIHSGVSSHIGNSEPHRDQWQSQTFLSPNNQGTAQSPRISIEEHVDGKLFPQSPERLELPRQSSDHDLTNKIGENTQYQITKGHGSSKANWLPPLPALPSEPVLYDPESYPDEDTRNVARQEFSHQLKSYAQALKDHQRVVKDRQKLVQKLAKGVCESDTRLFKGGSKDNLWDTEQGTLHSRKEKPLRERKFCMLPSKVNGNLDPCWIRVFMNGFDEVDAHCSLFSAGEHYEWLVNDVAKRIGQWVKKGEDEKQGGQSSL